MKRKMQQRVSQRRRHQRNMQMMIAKTHCSHGFDIACLICGFGEVDGKRVWHDWSKRKGELA